MVAFEGHNAPYSAPVKLPVREVPSAWIDYNGHMNVAYYVMAIDKAMDVFLEQELGVGETHVARVRQGPYALQMQVHYLGEILEGERFYCSVRLIDCDTKRIHVFVELFKADGDELAATYEQLIVNVDLETRRSTPYPEWAQARMRDMLAAHARLERPTQLGAIIGIRRKG
ncbi:MAG: thioesterase family protein [Paracoccaceae bacterium]|jgi:acyl-CoA thioester hydrolase